MKKIFLLSCFFLIGMIVSAQSRWAFGIEVEAGVSGERDVEENYQHRPEFGDYAYNSQSRRRPGMSGGIWTEYLLSHRLGLRMGVNYAQMQTFTESENTSYNTAGVMTSYSRNRRTLDQSQLRIPLEGKLYFGSPDRRWRAFVSLGAQAGYLFTQKNIRESFNGTGGQLENYESIYTTEVDFGHDNYEAGRWQMAVISGLGVTTEHFTLSLQRTWGVSEEKTHRNSFDSSYPELILIDYYPHYYNSSISIPQLRLTSLRFAYRLF